MGLIADFAARLPVDTERSSGGAGTEGSPRESRFVQIPTDHPRSSMSAYEAAFHRCEPGEILGGLTGTTIHAEFVAAMLAVLHRHAQQNVVALDMYASGVGSGASFGRAVIECHIPADASLSFLATEVALQWESRNAVAFDPPSSRTSGGGPNIAITWAAAARSGSLRDDLEPMRALAPRPTSYDINLVVTGQGHGMKLIAVYNAKLFERATIARWLDGLVTLLAAGLAAPELPIHRLPILGTAELQVLQALQGISDSGRTTSVPRPAHHQFADWARATPEASAATLDGGSLSYGELDRRSDSLARHLVACGVGPGVAVAVCVLPSFDVLVGMLAIFKAGGVYLPLDPTHPEALLGAILDEACPRVVLTQSRLSALTQPARFPQFHFDADDPTGTPGADEVAPSSGWLGETVSLDQPCYQLYTSGTTGRPKGVLATHRNLAHYLGVAREKYGFCAEDVFCSLARYTFSISLFELLSPLCCGGTVRLLQRDDVLAPDRLARTLTEVTVVHAGPSLLANLFRYLRTDPSAPRSFPRMRHASSGGDLVPPHLLEEMKRVFEHAELFVIYGCTEVSCMGTTFPVRREVRLTRSYVGKPFPDVAVRLLDAQLNRVPFGVVGEICFAGGGVVSGYVDRPELTAEKFVSLEGRTFYRTGDLGRLHPDGNVEILGRRDFQIQLRGIRIELTGIENTIRTLGLAFQCVVLAKRVDEHDVRLVAFLVKPREENPTIAGLRHALAVQLPDYMLPQHLVVLDSLPLTMNGKVDRKRLEELPWHSPPATGSGGVSSRSQATNAVEKKIAAAFAACLGVEQVGIDDDFFDLGGHSLLAVTLMDELQNRIGLSFPPGVLFQRGTVRALAEHSQAAFATEPVPIPLNRNTKGPTVFVLVGVHLYRELARRLEPHVSVCAVYAGRELTMFEAPDTAPAVAALARDYVEIIRRHQPTGPYRLVGMSFGGIVAFEVARQLRADGQETAFLGLLDAVLPERGARARLEQLRRLWRTPRREVGDLIRVRARASVKRAWAQASGGTVGQDPGEFTRYAGEARFRPLEDQRQEAYRAATLGYVTAMRPSRDNAVLVVAMQRLRRTLMQSSALGWRSFIPGLAVHHVDCDHLRLLEEPHVDAVAEVLLEAMRLPPPPTS